MIEEIYDRCSSRSASTNTSLKQEIDPYIVTKHTNINHTLTYSLFITGPPSNVFS